MGCVESNSSTVPISVPVALGSSLAGLMVCAWVILSLYVFVVQRRERRQVYQSVESNLEVASEVAAVRGNDGQVRSRFRRGDVIAL